MPRHASPGTVLSHTVSLWHHVRYVEELIARGAFSSDAEVTRELWAARRAVERAATRMRDMIAAANPAQMGSGRTDTTRPSAGTATPPVPSA